MDQPEVEKEVRRLFRYDAEAIDVKYEIIMDDEKVMDSVGPEVWIGLHKICQIFTIFL